MTIFKTFYIVVLDNSLVKGFIFIFIPFLLENEKDVQGSMRMDWTCHFTSTIIIGFN